MLTKHQSQIGAEFWHMIETNADGSPCRARRNGKTQVWITRPAEFKIPVKFGFARTFYITEKEAHQWCLPCNWGVEKELFRGVTSGTSVP